MHAHLFEPCALDRPGPAKTAKKIHIEKTINFYYTYIIKNFKVLKNNG